MLPKRLALIGCTLAIATESYATEPRITRGQAEAVFQAFSGGGWAISLHSETMEGAPADFLPDAVIRIGVDPGFNGRHYCALDWHVIHVALNEGILLGETRTNLQLIDALASRQVELRLDGVVLETERTAARRSLIPNRGFVEAFFVNVGRVMAPEELSAGSHRLVGIGSRPGVPPRIIGSITFHVDAQGTGVCGSDALEFREVG